MATGSHEPGETSGKKVRALLVWPEFPLTYWGGQYSLSLVGKRAVMPPLGLLTVAALCPPEWDLRLVDLNIEELSRADLEWADLCLISGMAIQHESMIETIERCRAAGVPTAVGGPHATSSKEKFENASYLVLGEGELTFPRFARDYMAGAPLREYAADEVKPDMALSPVPRFDLLKMDAYIHMCIQFSRGCPFSCEFCDITTLFGKLPRTKTAAQILAELQAIYDLGFRGEIFIVDDNFVGNKKNVKLMLPELIAWLKERGLPFSFYTEASLTLADDDELLGLMRDAGFYAVFVGIETPSLESLRETQKHQNLRGDMISKVHKIHRYGMEVMAGFIVGFDQDREDIFERQIDFITAARIPMAMVGPLNAMPGTPLWIRLESEGRLSSDWAGDTFDFCNFTPVMPVVSLVRGYRKVLATLYEPAAFFQRLYDLIDTMRGGRYQNFGQLNLKNNARYFIPLLSALFSILIVNEDRCQYMRFFWRVLRNHPTKILLALCRAIIGYHLIEFTKVEMIPRLTRLELEFSERELVGQAPGR